MLLIFGGGGIAQGIANVWQGPVGLLPRESCDVTDKEQVGSAFEFYAPRYVVNCAGVSCAFNYQREIETNLIGSLHVAEIAGLSSIPTILLASVAGLYGKPNHVGYCASKAGVISVVQSLACEGRRIWAISPGRVDTPMRERDYPNDTPGSRLTPEQIGNVVVDIFRRNLYAPGTNIVIRKEGLDTVIVHEHKGDGWKERLRVGEPVTI